MTSFPSAFALWESAALPERKIRLPLATTESEATREAAE
jgi:hypothetical protein